VHLLSVRRDKYVYRKTIFICTLLVVAMFILVKAKEYFSTAAKKGNILSKKALIMDDEIKIPAGYIINRFFFRGEKFFKL
jgi:hypothetical protein